MKNITRVPVAPTPERYIGFADESVAESYSTNLVKAPEKLRNLLSAVKTGEGLFKASGPFHNILTGVDLASPYEVGMRFNENPNNFSGIYTDFGLILKSEGDSYGPNNDLARNLYRKLAKKGKHATPQHPVMISLRGLKIQSAPNTHYGAVFNLGDETVILQNESVDRAFGSSKNKRFTLFDIQGVPIEDSSGKYTIWNREEGVSRLYVSGRGVSAGGRGFKISADIGRVVERGGVVNEDAKGVALGYTEVEKATTELETQKLEQEKARREAIKGLEERLAILKN